MANQFRRLPTSDIWHFCSNCSNWPTGPYVLHMSLGMPDDGLLCTECIGKKQREECA